MNYLIDIGSSTVKFYSQEGGRAVLLNAKTFSFKDGFESASGLSSVSRQALLRHILDLAAQYSLNRVNAKVYATGVFRELANPRHFVEDFYAHTGLYFNIVSHELEAFYLERTWVGGGRREVPWMVINIGNHTTELVFYEGDLAIGREMLAVGVGSVRKRYSSLNHRFSSVSLSDVVDHVRQQLPTATVSCDWAVYTGGELNYMKLADYALRDNHLFVDGQHPYVISMDDYSDRNLEVFSEVSIEDLRALMPENPGWMDGARACSAIAQAICAHYGVKAIVPSDSNLIDGVVVQEVARVALCGSYNKHIAEISELARLLRAKGIEVLSPKDSPIVGRRNGFLLFAGDEMVNNCTWPVEAVHLKAIEECDLVVICNYDDYVGTKTSLEIGYAYKCGKRIAFLKDGSSVSDFDLPSEVGLLSCEGVWR